MEEKILRYIKGYVKLRIEGVSVERFINLCSYHEITMWEIMPLKDSYELYMTLSGFWKIRPFAKKTHTKVTILKRYGFPFFLHQHRKRQLLFVGILVFVGLIMLYSNYIWEIDFDGNKTRTTIELLDFLEKQNIKPGLAKRNINCVNISESIRKNYDDIVWVSTSIDGSCLHICVKENDYMKRTPIVGGSQYQTLNQSLHPTDLVAAKDGVITSIVTRAGVPQVHIGDCVKAGDILVCGRMELLDDTKEVVGYRYCNADADVFANTKMLYQDEMEYHQKKIEYKKKTPKVTLYLKLKNKEFWIGARKQSEKLYEKNQKIYIAKLGKHYYLPIFYGKIIWKPIGYKLIKLEKKDVKNQLQSKFHRFLEDLDEKGIQICGNDVKIHLDENSGTATGMVYLNESIIKAVDTEILEIERNEQNESIGTDD